MNDYPNGIYNMKVPLFCFMVKQLHSEKTADSARIHVRFTLTNGNNEEQELILQRREGKWEIADFIRPNSGSLLKQIEAKTAARLKQ